jgi:uncharacterized membrane protein YjgN (DUF898 family)
MSSTQPSIHNAASAPAFHISLRPMAWLGGSCGVVFSLVTLLLNAADQALPALGFALFALLSVLLAVSAGTLEFTDVAVSHRNFFGHFRMRWADVRQVETGLQGARVLRGVDQRFVLVPVAFWRGAEKSEAFALLRAKLASIPSRQDPLADFKVHKNVRVRSQAA